MSGYTLDISQETYRQLLVDAAKSCDVDAYHLFVSQGADPLLRWRVPDEDDYDNWDDYYYDDCLPQNRESQKYHNSLLVVAAQSGCAQIVEHLLTLGADIHQVSRRLLTPLSEWCQSQPETHPHCEWERTAEILLRAGCDPNDINGQAWKMAKLHNNEAAKRIFTAWEAEKKAKTLSDATNLVFSASKSRRL